MGPTRHRRLAFVLGALLVGATGACIDELNPQPLPPDEGDRAGEDGTGGSAGKPPPSSDNETPSPSLPDGGDGDAAGDGDAGDAGPDA